jgi:hypothetical protein
MRHHGIRAIMARPPELGNAPLDADCLELSSGGTISYYSDAERQALNEFIADPTQAYDLLPHDYRLDAVGGASIDMGAYSLGRLYMMEGV